MQERQTQVLALPTRVDGKERETEGILRGVPLRDLNHTHGRSLWYSQKFPPASHRRGWLQSIPDTQGTTESRGEGTPMSFSLPLSLSDGPSHSHSLTCEFPPSKARRVVLLLLLFLRSLSLSLMLSLPLPSSCLCSSIVTLFCGQEKRDGPRVPCFFSHNSILLQQSLLVPPLPYPSNSYTT